MLRSCVRLGVMCSNHIHSFHELQQEGKTKLVGVVEVKEILTREIANKYRVNWVAIYKRLLQEKPEFAILVITKAAP